MATVQQLMTALRQADAAGNTADAKRFAQMIRQAQSKGKKKDTSLTSAFMSGIDAPLENIAATAGALGFDKTAQTLSGLTEAPENYESASNRFINPEEGDNTLFGYGIDYLPRAFVEQLGQYGGSLASRVAGAGIGTAVAGPAGGVAGAVAAPALFEFVQQLGPVALERAKNNNREEPTWDDWTAAASTAGLSGALNALGVRSGGLLNSILKEGVTEATQSAVTQTGESLGTEAGLDVNPREAIGEGILGGTAAGGVKTGTAVATAPVKATRAAVNLVSGGGGVRDVRAAADFARDVQAMADEAAHDLNDVDPTSTSGAKMALDDVHADYAETMKGLATKLKERLNYKDTDDNAVTIDKIIGKTALRKGRNKAKNIVNKKDFKILRKLVGDTEEGQNLLNVLAKSNELTRTYDKGLKGGVSRVTDIFNPLESNAGYSNTRNLIGAMATLGGGAAAVGTLGASIPAQAALVGAGRGIDALTGRRSRVAKFVRENAANPGLDAPTARSLSARNQEVEAARQAQEQAARNDVRKENLELVQRGAAPTPDSPQDTVEQATGLTRQGVARILRTLKRAPGTNNAIRRAIEEYETSVATGGKVENISPLIRRINLTIQQNPIFQQLRVREPVRYKDDRGQAVLEGRQQKGKADNAEQIRQLRDKANKDNDLNDFDKRVINDALDALSLNLGQNPLEAANTILDEATTLARNKSKVDEYIKPYVDRIKRQQRGKKDGNT